MEAPRIERALPEGSNLTTRVAPLRYFHNVGAGPAFNPERPAPVIDLAG